MQRQSNGKERIGPSNAILIVYV